MSEASQRITVERLLAVQRALGPERLQTEVDILLESIVVALRNGPLPDRELVDHVRELWPGTRLSEDRVHRAATAGVKAKILAPQESLDGEPGFQLLADADPQGEASRRTQSILKRTRDAVAENFAEELDRSLFEDETEQLAAILIEALSAGVRESFAAYEGAVRPLSSTTLLPERYDEDAIDLTLDQAGLDPQTREVLGALARAALNPASRFGTEIVTQIAIGYILQGFVARRDQIATIESVGVLAGTAIFLDTPHLLSLTGKTPSANSLLTTLNAAVKSRLRVIVPSHCLDELNTVLDGAERSGAIDIFRRSLSEGDDPYYLQQTTDDEAIQAWMSHATVDEPCSWEQYRNRVQSLKKWLVELGFNVMSLPNTSDAGRLMAKCREAMREVLLERPREGQRAKGPREDALRHDAATMALALNARWAAPGKRFWPGAWVLTPDRRMIDAHRRVDSGDEFPLTLSSAQLAALLGTFVTPSTAPELARAAANLMSHETLLRIATRFPPEVAVGIAHSLHLRGARSDVDVHVAQQLSLDELFGEEPLSEEEQIDLVLHRVLDSRASRREKLAEIEVGRARRERDEALSVAASASDEVLELEKTYRKDREKQREVEEGLKQDLANERQRREQAENEVDDTRGHVAIANRKTYVLVAGSVLLTVGVLLFLFTPQGLTGIATLVVGAIFVLRGSEWVENDPVPWGKFGLTLLIESLAVIDLIR